MSDADTILEFIRDEAVDLPSGVSIDADTSLFKDQLLDSMSLTNLITFLEDEFGIRIGAMDVVFENLDTVNHMLAFVERKRVSRSVTWLRRSSRRHRHDALARPGAPVAARRRARERPSTCSASAFRCCSGSWSSLPSRWRSPPAGT